MTTNLDSVRDTFETFCALQEHCSECPFWDVDTDYCPTYIREHPDETMFIITDWYENHPAAKEEN